jgi:hypothetical protein
MIEINTWEQFIARARELRRLADAAEAELLEFLYACEQRRELWAASGKLFDTLIEEANLIKGARYREWKRVREGLGKEAIEGIGTNGVVAAGRMNTPAEQRAVLDRVRQHERVNETSISDQSARRIANEERIFQLGRHHAKGYAELVRENDALRAKLREAEQRIELLKAELRAAKRSQKRPVKKAA